MKVYISADMEGVSGLVEAQDVQPTGSGYEVGCKFMTEDVNAAVRGAFDGGASEVFVNDAHGPMRNILPESLDRRATLIRGKSKTLGMLEGLDNTFDAVICVGFHARAGKLGVLSHSFMGHEVEDMWLNGKLVGEIGLLHAVAESIGVPVVFLSGDDVACEEMNSWDKKVKTVIVKKAIDRFSAELVSLIDARKRIESLTKESIEFKAGRITATNSKSTLTVRWQSASVATHLAGLPNVELKDERTAEINGPILSLYRQLFVFFKVAVSLSNQQPYC
ncbi:MAG: M55 family metallopeptidase [Candidatus Saccharibacteria bacterium]